VLQVPDSQSRPLTVFWKRARWDVSDSVSQVVTTVLPASRRLCCTKLQPSQGTNAVSTVCVALLYSSQPGIRTRLTAADDTVLDWLAPHDPAFSCASELSNSAIFFDFALSYHSTETFMTTLCPLLKADNINSWPQYDINDTALYCQRMAERNSQLQHQQGSNYTKVNDVIFIAALYNPKHSARFGDWAVCIYNICERL